MKRLFHGIIVYLRKNKNFVEMAVLRYVVKPLKCCENWASAKRVDERIFRVEIYFLNAYIGAER